MSHHEPGQEYVGRALLVAAGNEVEVQVDLRSTFQPIDGRLHWYGRIASGDELAAVRAGTAVELCTDHGSAEAKVSDVDPWGRLRVTGVGRPPF